MKNKTKIIIIIAAVLLGAGGVFLVIGSNNEGGLASLNLPFIFKGEQSKEEPKGESGQEETVPDFALETKESSSDSSKVVYYHPKYGFSFECDKSLKVTAFDEGGYGETILAQGDNEKNGFQIFVSPFDEAGPITPERIRQDLPDLTINQPQQVIITKNNITGLIFFSREPSLGETREVWFIHDGYLYQMTTYASLDNWVGRILETWKFD